MPCQHRCRSACPWGRSARWVAAAGWRVAAAAELRRISARGALEGRTRTGWHYVRLSNERWRETGIGGLVSGGIVRPSLDGRTWASQEEAGKLTTARSLGTVTALRPQRSQPPASSLPSQQDCCWPWAQLQWLAWSWSAARATVLVWSPWGEASCLAAALLASGNRIRAAISAAMGKRARRLLAACNIALCIGADDFLLTRRERLTKPMTLSI